MPFWRVTVNVYLANIQGFFAFIGGSWAHLVDAAQRGLREHVK